MRFPSAQEILAPSRDMGWSGAELDRFRRDLATTLRFHAERKRQSMSERAPFEGELRTIRVLERLADDAKNLSPHVFLLYQALFANDALTRTYRRDRSRLFAGIGIDYTPSDATDLIRWIVGEVAARAYRDSFRRGERRRTLHDQPGLPLAAGSGQWKQGTTARTIAIDFSAGLAVVTPILAIWEVRQGLGQWRDHAFAAAHPPVPATIQSVIRFDGGRSGSFLSAVLSFKPSLDSPACTVTLKREVGAAFPPIRATLQVVPRGPTCAEPLIPAEIGDPYATLGLAVALMIGGLATLKLWGRLAQGRDRARDPSLSSPLRRSACRDRHRNPAL